LTRPKTGKSDEVAIDEDAAGAIVDPIKTCPKILSKILLFSLMPCSGCTVGNNSMGVLETVVALLSVSLNTFGWVDEIGASDVDDSVKIVGRAITAVANKANMPTM